MNWTSLGTVTPTELGPWYPFPQPITGTDRPTVLIACTNVQPADRFRSWAWFRTKLTLPGAAEPIYTPAFRIYPTPDPQVRELSIPSPLRHLEGIELRPEIKKLITYRGLSGTTNETPWGISLSQWNVAPAPASPLSVSWRVEDLFADHYLAEIMVYNSGEEPIYEWALSFNADDNITDTWGAELEALGVNTWGLAPSLTSGDVAIMPGQTRIFTIQGEGQPNLTNLTAIVL